MTPEPPMEERSFGVPAKRHTNGNGKSNAVLSADVEHLSYDVRGLCEDIRALEHKVDRLYSRFTLFFGIGIGAMAASGLIKEGAESALIKLLGLF